MTPAIGPTGSRTPANRATAALAVLRIARRNVRRSPWRSLLVGLLVMLPVTAMVAAATLVQTVTPTTERSVLHRMGQADLLAYPSGTEATIEALRQALPPASRIEPFRLAGGRLVLPGTEAPVALRSADLDGLARGMLTIVDGRPPRNPSEVAISAPVAALAGVGIGDPIELRDLGAPTVVGLVEDSFNLKARIVLQDVSRAWAAAAEGEATWLIGLPPGATVDGAPLAPPADSSGNGWFSTQSRDEVRESSDGATPAIIVIGGLALVEAALVASAAFAVSVRRRQRELGLLAATGASPGHLAGTVLAEGAVLGGLGALVGVGVGLAAALLASPWLDQLTDRRNPPPVIVLESLAAAAAIGLLAAFVAAIVPAWSAARLPVLVALSGRRPPASPARRTLGLGVVMIAVAVALTSSGAAMRLQDSTGSTSLLLMLAGAVLGTLGFGACSPWALERLERPAGLLPIAGRIALRDTARARSRNGPIVTAILASFAATVALAAYAASQDASTAATWQSWLRADQIVIQGEGAAEVGPDVARELGAIAAAPIPGAGSDERWLWISVGDSTDPNEGFQNVSVGDAELLRALGAESAIGDLEGGAVILLLERPADVTRVTLRGFDAEGVEVARLAVPATVIVTGIAAIDLPSAVLSAATASRIGVVAGARTQYVIRLGRPVDGADLARAGAMAAESPDTWADASLGPTRPGDAFRLAMLVASVLFALSVTGVAVALGEAESRPDQRTLLALGAAPGLRRRIAAARAGVLTGLAGALAVPAGLLPVWGLLSSRGAPLVVPVPEIVVALAVLPLLAIAGTWLVGRPIPTWSAFRNPST